MFSFLYNILFSTALGLLGNTNTVCTVVAEAMDAGARGALVYVELAVGAGEAFDTVAAETQREVVQVRFFHTLCPVLAWIIYFTWQDLAVYT